MNFLTSFFLVIHFISAVLFSTFDYHVETIEDVSAPHAFTAGGGNAPMCDAAVLDVESPVCLNLLDKLQSHDIKDMKTHEEEERERERGRTVVGLDTCVGDSAIVGTVDGIGMVTGGGIAASSTEEVDQSDEDLLKGGVEVAHVPADVCGTESLSGNDRNKHSNPSRDEAVRSSGTSAIKHTDTSSGATLSGAFASQSMSPTQVGSPAVLPAIDNAATAGDPVDWGSLWDPPLIISCVVFLAVEESVFQPLLTVILSRLPVSSEKVRTDSHSQHICLE